MWEIGLQRAVPYCSVLFGAVAFGSNSGSNWTRFVHGQRRRPTVAIPVASVGAEMMIFLDETLNYHHAVKEIERQFGLSPDAARAKLRELLLAGMVRTRPLPNSIMIPTINPA